MEKTVVTAFGKMVVPIEKVSKRQIAPKTKAELLDILYCGGAFFMGRNFLFGFLNPAAFAFAAVALGRGTRFYGTCAAAFLGLIYSGQDTYTVRYLLTFLLLIGMDSIVSLKIKKLVLWQKATLIAVVLALSGFAAGLWQGLLVFYSVIGILEGVMASALTWVFAQGLGTLRQIKRRKILTGEELMCMGIVLVFGCGSFYPYAPYGTVLWMFLSVVCVLTVAARGGTGVGTVIGVIFGFFLFLEGKASTTFFCLFALWGLFAGLFAPMGRLVVCGASIVLTLLFGFYIDNSLLQLEMVRTICLASVCFLFLPRRIFGFLNTYACYESGDLLDQALERKKEQVTKRLSSYANGFYCLSKLLHKLEVDTDDKKTEQALVDKVCGLVCRRCGVFHHCWEENFYNAYRQFSCAVSLCHAKGGLPASELPVFFRDCCYRENIVVEINKGCGYLQASKLWEKKLFEMQCLMGQQLGVAGDMLNHFSKDIQKDWNPATAWEQAVVAYMEQRGKRASLSLFVNDAGECWGEARVKAGGDSREVKELLSAALEEATCLPFSIQEKEAEKNKWVFKLNQAPRFGLATGIASCKMEGSEQSGDNYSHLETEDGSAFMILADGMGSGRQANKESKTAIELLESLLEYQFPKNRALMILNGVLLAREAGDSYSTLDIFSVNLHTGEGIFTKAGGASAYLWRQGTVTPVRSHSLPVGVLKNMEPEQITMPLQSGDVILMMTDGVEEVIEKNGDASAWLIEKFSAFFSHNPQDVAEYILKETKGGHRDDQMVFVGRLWEK